MGSAVDAVTSRSPTSSPLERRKGPWAKNDTFEIEGLLSTTAAILMVYDRWGNLVFQSDNYDNHGMPGTPLPAPTTTC